VFNIGEGDTPPIHNTVALFILLPATITPCSSPYALAKSRRLPLLYQGDDFSHTDVQSVLQAWQMEGSENDRTQATSQ
jgi:hypothetical protein